MSIVEFVLGFAAIIIGLGVADLLVSLHRLLRAAERVKWDWLALSFATLMLYVSVCFWWFSYRLFGTAVLVTVADFLPTVAFLCLSFLMMAAALPDDVPEAGVDLRAFYMSSRAHIWTLVSASLVLSIVISLVGEALDGLLGALGSRWPVFISTALALACIRSPRIWVHAAAIVWIFTVTSFYYLFQKISSA